MLVVVVRVVVVGIFGGVWMWLKDDGKKACCRLGFPSSHQSLTPSSTPSLPAKTLPQSTPQAIARTPKKPIEKKKKRNAVDGVLGDMKI